MKHVPGVTVPEREALLGDVAPASRRRIPPWTLTAFLILPLAVVTLLCWTIAGTLRNPRGLFGPPVGAGAGSTAGANAIGELLAGHKANASAGAGVNADQAGSDDKRTAAGVEHAAAPKLVRPESLEQGFILIVQDKSGKASASSPIYLAGNINRWNPGDTNYRLEAQSDMRWRIALSKPDTDQIQFKFTRGDWKLEELKEDMSVPGNRTLPMIDAGALAPGEKPKIELVVHHWGDEQPGNEPDAAYKPVHVNAGTLRRLQVAGGAGNAMGRTRDLLVWLPPGYDDPANASKQYPVLYMHDGQNLFEKHAGIPAEWRMDETAAELIAAGKIKPLIVVGVPHSGETRFAEYLPPGGGEAPVEGVTAQGDRHVEWLVHEVMPRVRRAFRVTESAADTGVGGASMGGLIALYAAKSHPEAFGLVLAESPALRLGTGEYWRGVFEGSTQWRATMYMAIGTGEAGKDQPEKSALFADAVRLLDEVLARQGLDAARKKVVIEEGAIHNEDAWAKRLPGALEFLYPAKPLP